MKGDSCECDIGKAPRKKEFPIKIHELIDPETREGPAEPDEAEHHDHRLSEHPDPAGNE